MIVDTGGRGQRSPNGKYVGDMRALRYEDFASRLNGSVGDFAADSSLTLRVTGGELIQFAVPWGFITFTAPD